MEEGVALFTEYSKVLDWFSTYIFIGTMMYIKGFVAITYLTPILGE